MRWSYLCQGLLSLSQGRGQREGCLIYMSVSLGALPSQFKPGKYCGLAEVCPGRRNEDLTVRPGPSHLRHLEQDRRLSSTPPTQGGQDRERQEQSIVFL